MRSLRKLAREAGDGPFALAAIPTDLIQQVFQGGSLRAVRFLWNGRASWGPLLWGL